MQNRFGVSLFKQAEERFSVETKDMPYSEWIEKNTTLKKRPFSFKGYEFQRKIVDDMHPDLSVIKISQVGLTEVQIRKALAFLTRNRGTSLIFSLPNEDMFTRISKGRVRPIVNEDKVFNKPEDAKSVRSAEMMQFGQSMLYLVPALEQAATSISADFVMNDEVDLSDQKMISLFQSRLQASKFKISQKFSTPSFPLYGIDLNWQASDQQLYMCRCDSCGHWQHPEFNRRFVNIPGLPDNIDKLSELVIEQKDDLDLINCFVQCEKCYKPLDLGNPRNREWVATHPSRRDSRGYRVGPFSTENLTIPYILKSLWEYKKNSYMRGFYNTVLGEPYSDGDIQIPIEDIEAAFTNDSVGRPLSEYQDLWVGIDVGEICHVVIGSGPGYENIDIVQMYQVKASELVSHVEDLCKKYNIRGGCIDRHPYTPTSNDVRDISQGRIVPTEYRGQKSLNLVMYVDDPEKVEHAQVNRTIFLDNFASRIKKRKMKISGYGQYRTVFREHLRDMVRSETPEKEATWEKLQGIDHFFHAAAFMLQSPELSDFIRFKSKTDQRSSILTLVANPQESKSQLIGTTKKKLDMFGLIH